MTMTSPFGSRCTAQDGLGNRCFKEASHRASLEASEGVHDASRGSLSRLWN